VSCRIIVCSVTNSSLPELFYIGLLYAVVTVQAALPFSWIQCHYSCLHLTSNTICCH